MVTVSQGTLGGSFSQALIKGQPLAWPAFVSPANKSICLIVCIYPAWFTFLLLISMRPSGPLQDLWLDV